MIRDCREDQVFQLSRGAVRNDVWVRAQINEPFIRRPVMRYESTGIVVVPRTNCDGNNVRLLLNDLGKLHGLVP